MPIRIGITGGIGSGKSVVSRLLEVMGIPVYISDVESKRVTAADSQIRQGLCELVGEEVFCEGKLNKPLLASYLFASSENAQRVNGIIHPRVKEDFRRWVAHRNEFDIVGIESAILIESGFAGEVDVIVMVSAPLEIRVQRVMRRDNSPRELIMKRVERQMCDEEKKNEAGFVIVNDGESPMIPQVLELISFLYKNIHYLCSRNKITHN